MNNLDCASIPDINFRETANRIESHVKKLPGGCWEWQAFTRKVRGHLYPMTSLNGHVRTVRPIVWMLVYGIEAKGPITNCCGNERCVSPLHVERFISSGGDIDHARKFRYKTRREL